MDLYTLTDKKHFMTQLIKSDLFDSFELREGVVHTLFKTIIDGKRNPDFFPTDEPRSSYLQWGEVRSYMYHLLAGQKPPTYFKLILSTSKAKTEALSTELDTCFLNITFKDNLITCSTGVAYHTFSLDKTPEKIWDERIKKFLLQYNFI